MEKYPTKEEIIAASYQLQINPQIIKETKKWKKKYTKNWKKNSNSTKINLLNLLLLILTEIERQSNKTIHKINFSTGIQYKYNPTHNIIYHNLSKPSIISSLHELAHHFYGPDELKACTWSTYLFITCFPLLYKQLEWDNHLLIKKQS
jgi:hypothetical protein